MVLGIFDHAFYINCEHRSDRRQFFEQQALLAGIEVERVGVTVPEYKGRFESAGARGCAESHLKLWKLARHRKYRRVLIFEDDASLTIQGLKALQEHRNTVLQTRWDMFYFQVKRRHTSFCENLPKGIHRVKASILTHAYAVSITAYDYLIEMQSKNDAVAVDVFLHDSVHPRLEVYGIGPAVAFQLKSQSDVGPRQRPSNIPIGGTPVYKDSLLVSDISAKVDWI